MLQKVELKGKAVEWGVWGVWGVWCVWEGVWGVSVPTVSGDSLPACV